MHCFTGPSHLTHQSRCCYLLFVNATALLLLLLLDRQIQALVEDKYMNHMKMSELEEQRARLTCEVECLKAAAKSSTQSEQQWKGFVSVYCSCLVALEHARTLL